MAEAKSQCSTLALHIKNFPPVAAEDEGFNMFLENKTNQENFSIEYNSAFNEAFVMFDNLTLSPSEIISRIRQQPLLGNDLTVDKTHSNSRIIAANIKPNVEQQWLELYFESPKVNPTGCSVQVEFDCSRHVAIVTFSDPSAIEMVLSANHSNILGSEATVRRCAYFESLASNAFSRDEEEFDQETASNAGSTYSELRDFDGNEDVDENAETGSVSGETSAPNRGHRGSRRERQGGRRGGRRGNRRGYPSFGTDGRGEFSYDRQSSLNSERMYGERGGEAGHYRSLRGRRGGGDGRLVHNWDGRRPPSGRDGGGDHPENFVDRGNRRGGWRRPFDGRGSAFSHVRDHSHDDRENQRGGNRRPFGGTGWGRGNHSDSAEPRQDGPNRRRAGSIPSLLDQPISSPVDTVHKEIEVRNEVSSEKCHLLTKVLRDIKSRHRCNVFVDVSRHRVVLDGPESAVTAATEDVYSRLCAMHSARLELPPAFAKKLSTRDGHRQIVDFFKNAQTQAVYYADADGHPMIIACDEYSAVSAMAQLRGKIKTEEVDYKQWQVAYLSSDDWVNFVSSAQRNWLLAVEIAPRNSILVIGIADDVAVAAESIRTQLGAINEPSRTGQAAGARQQHRQAAVRRPPQSLQEPTEACPICSVFFPLSAIADHADQCAERNRQCPICGLGFPPPSSTEEYQGHVDSHFF